MATLEISIDTDTLAHPRRAAVLAAWQQLTSALLGDPPPVVAEPSAEPKAPSPPSAPPARLAPVVATTATPDPSPTSTTEGTPATSPPPAPAHDLGQVATAVLNHIADEGGVWEGTFVELANAAWKRSPASAQQVRANLEEQKLVTIDRASPRKIRTVTLTPKGYKAIGRPRLAPAPTPRPVPSPGPEPEAVAVPPIPDLGPIEKHPFNPDAARAASADGI